MVDIPHLVHCAYGAISEDNIHRENVLCAVAILKSNTLKNTISIKCTCEGLSDLVVSAEPVDPSSQEVAPDPDTAALAMGVAVAGGRGVLQDVTPFSKDNAHINMKLYCRLNVCVYLPGPSLSMTPVGLMLLLCRLILLKDLMSMWTPPSFISFFKLKS